MHQVLFSILDDIKKIQINLLDDSQLYWLYWHFSISDIHVISTLSDNRSYIYDFYTKRGRSEFLMARWCNQLDLPNQTVRTINILVSMVPKAVFYCQNYSFHWSFQSIEIYGAAHLLISARSQITTGDFIDFHE